MIMPWMVLRCIRLYILSRLSIMVSHCSRPPMLRSESSLAWPHPLQSSPTVCVYVLPYASGKVALLHDMMKRVPCTQESERTLLIVSIIPSLMCPLCQAINTLTPIINTKNNSKPSISCLVFIQLFTDFLVHLTGHLVLCFHTWMQLIGCQGQCVVIVHSVQLHRIPQWFRIQQTGFEFPCEMMLFTLSLT